MLSLPPVIDFSQNPVPNYKDCVAGTMLVELFVMYRIFRVTPPAVGIPIDKMKEEAGSRRMMMYAI
jgi:hypothetical protein